MKCDHLARTVVVEKTVDHVTADHETADHVMADHHETVRVEATDLKDVVQAEDQMVDRWGRQILSGWLNTPCASTLTVTANLINQK